MKKLYVIRLTSEERDRLQALVHTGRAAAYKRRNAQLLLWVDQGEAGAALPDREAAERAGVTVRTVENVRRRCVLEGLERVLQRRARSRERSRVLDGQAEAQLVAIACSDAARGLRAVDVALVGRRIEAPPGSWRRCPMRRCDRF